MYTMRDVARLARVSTATVSFVVNNSRGVSEPLRRRVLEAMEALDYHPDHVARSLKVRQTKIIGMIIPQFGNPYFAELMRGVEDETSRFDYSVIFSDSNDDPELERRHLITLFSRRVDGLIISSSNTRLLESRIGNRRLPLVFVDRTPPGYLGPAVVSDNFGASREATLHLIGLGHTRIAIIIGPLELPITTQRLDGFRQALAEAHLPFPDEYFMRGDYRSESGYRCGCELMQLPNPPTAIFCCNMMMTLGLMRALAELNIPCPEQASVVAFDDFEWLASFRPKLTAVAQPTYEMGKRAAEILIRKIQKKADEPGDPLREVIVLPNELRIRESTAPPFCSLPLKANPAA